LTASDAPRQDAVPAGQPLILLDGVTLRSHGQTLFEGTSWQLHTGECWAFVGANGSGKSTLARALCGEVPVIAGQITYHFSDHGAAPYQRVAFVSFRGQRDMLRRSSSFHQARWNMGAAERSLPVAQFLSGGGTQRERPFQAGEERPETVAFPVHREEALKRLGIEPLLSKDLTQLSSGERRKVSIARALLERPRLLILENPVTGLDASSRTALEQVVDGLAQEDVSVILVTARLDALPPSVTHLLLVHEGRVVAQGRREAVLAAIGDPLEASPVHGRSLPGGPEPRGALSALIRMHDVRVRYGRRQILTGVDWTVKPGEHWALVGPNGAGKTTLLSLILGDHPQAYANDIVLFGRQRGSGESIWEIKEQIGWVAPELHLYYPEGSSCLDIVCSGFSDTIGVREPYTMAQRATAERWMQELGVGEWAGRRFGALSESQQRLALIARALVKMPTLLILDEPCQGLDTPNRMRVRHVVERIARESRTTVIYVTHEADELPSTVTHLLRLERGRVTYRGPIDHAPFF
jgi:molybdate transport system ATP-binding protein